MIRRLDALVGGDPRYAHTTDVVVLRDGELVFARRYGGGVDGELRDTYSVTKSVVATLVGIALGDGLLRSLDEPVHAGRTVRHLLTMTGGTEADGPWEIDEVLARPEGWRAHLEAAPRRDEPGARFRYDNGAVHLLGCALADAVGQSLERYAAERLFAPLGIDAWEWPADPEGYSWGFGHLRLRPRDLARIGELWRRGGEGIVPPPFVAEATRAQTAGGPPEGEAYGYLWWVGRDAFFGGGYAGQSLVVVPREGLVAVTIGAEERLRPGWRNARHAVAEALAA